jgi:hypothetical protein
MELNHFLANSHRNLHEGNKIWLEFL